MSSEVVVIADGDWGKVERLCGELAAGGYEVFAARSAGELEEVLGAQACDVAVMALDLPGEDVPGLARRLGVRWPDLCVVLMGDAEEVARRAQEFAGGGLRWVQEPVGAGQLLLAVEQAVESRRLRDENRMLFRQCEEDAGPEDFVVRSPQMVEVLREAATAAETDEPVLVYGAPGTEKEIIARYIHGCSARAERPFVRFECGRATGASEEGELFGCEERGPSGSVWRRSGRVELAESGTLFLDNVGELSARCQAKLLRFLEDGEFLHAEADGFGLGVRRGGGRRSVHRADVRLICAGWRDLRSPGPTGVREDLLFRLNTLSVTVPGLAERREDILPLAHRFLGRLAIELGRGVHDISPEAERLLVEYDWPGNVTELRDTMRSAVVGAEHEVLLPEDLLRGPLRRVVWGVVGTAGRLSGPELGPEARRTAVRQTRRRTAEAARRLGVALDALSSRVPRGSA